MTGFLADVTFGAVLLMGTVAVAGVLFLGQLTDARNAAHPWGFAGRLRDEAMTAGPIWLFLILQSAGLAFDSLHDTVWWFPVLFSLLGLALLGRILPPVRRAKDRLDALKWRPSQ